MANSSTTGPITWYGASGTSSPGTAATGTSITLSPGITTTNSSFYPAPNPYLPMGEKDRKHASLIKEIFHLGGLTELYEVSYNKHSNLGWYRFATDVLLLIRVKEMKTQYRVSGADEVSYGYELYEFFNAKDGIVFHLEADDINFVKKLSK